MLRMLTLRWQTARWRWIFSLLLAMAFLTPFFSVNPRQDGVPHAQPILLEMAVQRPEAMVGVIVQKQGKDARVEELVLRLGGVVTRDLSLINAFVAELPAKAIPELASASGVRWVSLDAPVVSRGKRKSDTVSYYLYNDPIVPTGDTPSHPVLPMSRAVPEVKTLYNYDVDRDGEPGLLIRRGGSGPDESDPAKVQRWRMGPFESDVQIVGRVELKLYAAMKDFREKRRGKIRAYLVDRAGDQGQVIASGHKEKSSWGDKWKRETIKFGEIDYTIPAGHQLEIALIVDESSEDDMWFAYGTKKQASHLKVNFFANWPNHFLEAIGAPVVWEQDFDGDDVRIAVVDSGIHRKNKDFKEEDQARVVYEVNLLSDYVDARDRYGHGTYIAGIIGSGGGRSGGRYKGVAPEAELINVRVSDDRGMARESDVVAGLQWIYEHRDEYEIRVVNISLNSTVAQSYHVSPLDAAAEVLWFNGIVVVVSAGNNGYADQGVLYPPANDPFVIVVGATDDLGTSDPADDIVAEFSAYGTTPEGIFRPDLVAPGTYVVSSLGDKTRFKEEYVDHVVMTPDRKGRLVETNFVASGTSVSAAVVTGSVALLLSAMPELNPDQVKYLLMRTATPLPDEPGAGAGVVNVARLIETALGYGEAVAVPAANTGLQASQLLWVGGDPMAWDSVNWDSVNWDSVNWDSVNWDSVNWESVDLSY